MTDFYAEERRLQKLRQANLRREDSLYQAMYKRDEQEKWSNSGVLVMNDHSGDVAKIISSRNVGYTEPAVANELARSFLRTIASREDAEIIFDNLDDNEIYYVGIAQNVIRKELKKYVNINPQGFVNMVQSLMRQDSGTQDIIDKLDSIDKTSKADRADKARAGASRVTGLPLGYSTPARTGAPVPVPVTGPVPVPVTGPVAALAEPVDDIDAIVGDPTAPLPLKRIDADLEIFRNPVTGEYDTLRTILDEPDAFSNLSSSQVKQLYVLFDHYSLFQQHENRTDKKAKGALLSANNLKIVMRNRANRPLKPKEKIDAYLKRTTSGSSTASDSSRGAVGGVDIGVTRGKGMNVKFKIHSDQVANSVKEPVRLIYGRGLRDEENVVERPYKKPIVPIYKSHCRYFDKIYIDMNRLKNNQLFIKYIYNNVSLKQLPSMTISDDLKEIVTDTINGHYNKKIFNTLSDNDKRLSRLIVKAFKLKAIEIPEDNETKEFREKYRVLVGSYLSGNDSGEIKKELLKYVRLGLAMKTIPQQEAYSLIYELAS